MTADAFPEARLGVMTPVLALAPFAFLLDFVWEFLQIPLYARMSQLSHLEGVISCGRAAAGDVLITVVAYFVGMLVQRDCRWILAPRAWAVWAYLGTGVLITVALEFSATRWLDRWQYSPLMPLVPFLQIGLAPLIQWLLVPSATLWLTRRHLLGRLALGARNAPPAQ